MAVRNAFVHDSNESRSGREVEDPGKESKVPCVHCGVAPPSPTVTALPLVAEARNVWDADDTDQATRQSLTATHKARQALRLCSSRIRRYTVARRAERRAGGGQNRAEQDRTGQNNTRDGDREATYAQRSTDGRGREGRGVLGTYVAGYTDRGAGRDGAGRGY
ncbi:hypothetical protein HETIRDRAFT_470227 [Heterobasidion irregulare TC 32-1]|uniref:Uncharacterized protein n=1 Tax=Heterobasidion irregulare (strain TC 32-1) TaxID=747525 RepID=W4KIM8_HETIT|nr:uncharacterized protein HETIRDRAFT_470227 [Heterobasidion irregulare TC 32-1]ETW85175.1 hypothetical protein HETIRDRAFT_470227 [Heterobasidion irregulare TC 32-1]